MAASDPPNFSFHAVSPFPSLAVAPSLTPSSSLSAPGKPCVIHFYNSG